ncbi:class I ribonucleotide reductase maintenance protein YfaE [Rheinheimera sp.]|uniref:class I ribonucleotide reductase maintenance protein YfaE n=1 Tax=Rheinheimera sp. TaxID=1869214 RepID=UPI003AF92452
MPKVLVNGQLCVEFSAEQGSLLDALEAGQQQVNYQCREGYCGACRCKLLSGSVSYLNEPLAFVRKGEFLPCCSIPVTDIEIEVP